MFSAARRARLALATQILDVDPALEGAWHKAGRAAEDEVVEWLKRNAPKGAKVFHSRRVPRQSGEKGRYEIDVILLTPSALTVIEVKNWAGQIQTRGESWVKRRQDGSWLVQDNPVHKTTAKLDALERYILGQGVALPRWIGGAVVLWNEHARPEAAIAKNPMVVAKDKIACLLPKTQRAGLSKTQMQALETALLDLEGFDTVTLYGGRKISGDLLRLKYGGRSYALQDLPRRSKTRVKMPRAPLWVRLRALFGFMPMIRFEGPLKGLCVMPRDRLVFQPAGEAQPVEIAIAALHSFERG